MLIMIYQSPLLLKIYGKYFQSEELKQLEEKEKEIIKRLKEKGTRLWFDYQSIEEFLDGLEVWRNEKTKEMFYRNFNKYVLKK